MVLRIELDAELGDEIDLGLEEVDVLLLGLEDALEELAADVIADLFAMGDGGLQRGMRDHLEPQVALGTDVETQHDAPTQPEQESGPADTITVEPTATGYRHMGRMFRDELDRVQRLRRRVGQLAHTADGETTDGETTRTEGELS